LWLLIFLIHTLYILLTFHLKVGKRHKKAREHTTRLPGDNQTGTLVFVTEFAIAIVDFKHF